MPRPRTLSREELLAALASKSAGAAVQELERRFPSVGRRTLQRHLGALVDEGAVIAHGEGRGRRYSTSVEDGYEAHPRGLEIREPSYDELADSGHDGGAVHAPIVLSDEAADVWRAVHRPVSARTPVGYRRDFLSTYQPNVTRYLSPSLRAHLHELGRSPVGDRPAGTYARQILDRLLIDLSWASSRLEGNTYSRLDTQNLIQFGQAAPGKDQREAQMILNHKAAIEMLVDQATDVGFNRYTVQNLHALLSDNLLPEPAAGGRLRRIDVAISGSVYQPTAMPQLIEECFDLILRKAQAIDDPFEQAFFVMVQLPYLQPFEDVNKRTSRLAANIPLIRGNLAPLSFVDVPEDAYVAGTLGVYELNRIELLRDVFVWAYERSCQRYTILRDALPAPDPLRLHFREAVRTLVCEVVIDGVRRDDTIALRSRIAALVDNDDINTVLALLVNELHQLHEGNIARYRLRPSQFRRWRDGQRR